MGSVDKISLTRAKRGGIPQDRLRPGGTAVSRMEDGAFSRRLRFSGHHPGLRTADELSAGAETAYIGRTHVERVSPSVSRADDTLFGHGPADLRRNHVDGSKCRRPGGAR